MNQYQMQSKAGWWEFVFLGGFFSFIAFPKNSHLGGLWGDLMEQERAGGWELPAPFGKSHRMLVQPWGFSFQDV